MRNITTSGLLAIYLMTACAGEVAGEVDYDIATEMEYLAIDPDAPAKDEAQKKRALELAKRLSAKGVKREDLYEAQLWLSSKSYVEHVFKLMDELKFTEEEIEYEIYIDLLLLSDNGRTAHSGAPVRLEYRKRHPGDSDNSLSYDTYIRTLKSDKQRVAFFHEMLEKEKVHIALACSEGLVSERGRNEVRDSLLELIGKEWGAVLPHAFEQALAFGYEAGTLKRLLLEKAHDATQLSHGESYGYVVDQLGSADYLSATEKLDALTAMVRANGRFEYLALSGWAGVYRELEAEGALEGMAIEFPTMHTEKLIGLLPCTVDMETSLAYQKKFTEMEALALARQVAKNGKISGPIVAGLLTRNWSKYQAETMYSELSMFRDKQAKGQAVVDALPVLLEAEVSHMAFRMLGYAIRYDAMAAPEHLDLLLKELEKEIERPRVIPQRMNTWVSLMASTGEDAALEILLAILDGSHPLNDKVAEEELEALQSLALFETGKFDSVVVRFEKTIADTMSKEGRYFQSHAIGALRGWPVDKLTGDLLKKAIETQLVDRRDDYVQKNGQPALHLFVMDPETTTTLKLELLRFIDAGDEKRIKRYEDALKAVANAEAHPRASLKMASKTAAGELLKRVR